jgi:hypothetical protein
VQQVLTASDMAAQTTKNSCTAGFVIIPGAWVSITIPPGASQLLTARFTALGDTGQSTAGFVGGAIEIMAGAHIFAPSTPGIWNYVVTNDTQNEFLPPVEVLDRSLVVEPGTYTITAKYCVYSSNGDPTAAFLVHRWHLTVEAAPVQ